MDDGSVNRKAGLLPAEAGSIKDNFLLRNVGPDVVAGLEEICIWFRATEGAQIFNRDDTQTDVYLIVEGSVRVLDHAQSGQEVAFSDIQTGEFFGELSAIDHKERSATVFAVEDSLLARIPGAEFSDFLLRYPEMSAQMIRYFVETIRGLNSRVVGLSSMTSVQRVYSEILQMSEPDPSGTGNWIVNNMPHHMEIAVWAGTSPETVARAIGQLLKAEIAKRRNKTLVIKDRQRLRDLVAAE